MASYPDMELLEAEMAKVAAQVDAALEKVLPPVDGYEAQLLEAMRYATFAGGKRLRPFLVLASGQLYALPIETSTRIACALECVHTYSLVHDDLPCMDDDDLRRGKPTVHKTWDEATAVLAGDALLTLSFEILSDPQTHRDSHIRIDLINALAKAAGAHGMVGGQMIDLLSETTKLDMGTVTRLQQMKTGALIRFATESGAIAGGATQTERLALQAYAHDLGLAYQIVDDLLDIDGDAEEMGKATGKDGAKQTLVSLMGVERARMQAEMLAEQAVAHLEPFSEQAELLRLLPEFVINRRS
ncbi:MAG: polyprenyl synthetase family protein [Alphaproteobacteria bacterium]|nr:polyprenyl synthetase family protein [Alphaproteobacteria bacterium]